MSNSRGQRGPAARIATGLGRIAFVLGVIVAIAAAGFVLHGREQTLFQLFGDPDTGQYDFDHPTRTPYPHDALACPAGTCGEARPDLTVPPLKASADAVYAAVLAAVRDLPSPDVRLDDPAAGELRAVVRTPWIRFADTLSARVRSLPTGETGLWLYSRSHIGRNDFGTNGRRIAGVLETVERRLGLPVTDPSRATPRS